MDLDKLISDLQRDEGWRQFLYDDANGHKIVPGYTLKGNATAAWGFALSVSPLTQAEAMPILESRADTAWNELLIALPWLADQPENLQRACANMGYNLGTTKFLSFNTFLSLLQQGKYSEAADDLEATAWHRQVADRAVRIEDLIRGA